MSMADQIKAVFEAAQTNEEVEAVLSKLEKGMDAEQIKAIICEAASLAGVQIDETNAGELADATLESVSGGKNIFTVDSWDDVKAEFDKTWDDICNLPETVKKSWEIFKSWF